MGARISQALRHELTFFAFVLLWIVGLLAFTVFPFFASLAMSFTSYNMLSPPKYIGVDNYLNVFADGVFRTSLKATLIYMLVVAPGRLVIALGIAILLNRKIFARNVFRSIFYIPSVATTIAVALLWQSIFNADFGLLNTALKYIGIEGPGWLISTRWALPSLIIMSLWNIGVPMVIFLAGLQSISPTYYEVASIDGAGAWHKFRHVTFPMLSSIIFFNLVLQIIICFQTFTEAFILTGGGPGDSTRLYALFLYQTAFRYFAMGKASALAWLLFILLFVITIFLFKTSNRWVYYASE